MNLSIISLISIFMLILLGTVSTYTDIKFKKAYNWQIVVFLIIGVGIQIAGVIAHEVSIGVTVINLLLTFIISVIFYMSKIWAAGDSKLFFTMILLISYPLYMTERIVLFPAFYVLGFIFTVSFIYVVIESAVLLCIDCKNKNMPSLKTFLPVMTKETVTAWLAAFLLADTCDALILYFENEILSGNMYLLAIINILISIVFLSSIRKQKVQIIIFIGCLVLRVVLWLTIQIAFSSFSIWTIIIVAITVVIRKFTGQYNYRTIPVSKLKTGDVLAKGSLILMLHSSVKGLPQYTDETTRCRLTEDEVIAIKRWEHSKYGQNVVTIVRMVPFAPFIFGGTLLYFAFVFFLGA